MNKISNYKFQFLIWCFSCCLFIASCKQTDVFEKNTVIPKYEWQGSFTINGKFVITDTVSAYNAIRHFLNLTPIYEKKHHLDTHRVDLNKSDLLEVCEFKYFAYFYH